MATNGTFTTSLYDLSGKTKHGLVFSWEQTSQSIANNTTTIKWTISGYSTYGYVKAQNITLKIDGVVIYQHLKETDGQIDLYNNTVVATGTHTIKHNTDGSKTFTAYLEGGVYVWSPNVSGTKNYTLTTIPRASSISATNVNIGSQTTITVSKAKSSFTSTITYKFGSLTGTIATKSTSTSIKWTVPTTFYAQIPNAKSGTCSLTCETFNGSTSLGTKTTTFTATAAESLCKPLLAPVVEDINNTTVALTGDNSILVKYHSKANTQVNPTVRNSATLKSVSTKHNGKTTNTGQSTFDAITSNVFEFSATDSRGYTGTATVEATMVNYIHPTCMIANTEFTTDGIITFTIKGSYFKGSFGETTNALAVRYRYKESGGTYTDWIVVDSSRESNSYTTDVVLNELDYRKQYVIQAKCFDALETATTNEITLSCIPVFDWSGEDFSFNVPVYFQGNQFSDFVIENGTEAMGSNGTWHWQKWASGKAECYGIRNFGNMACSTAWGSIYRTTQFSQNLPTDLFAYTPAITIDIYQSESGNCWVAKGGTPLPTPANTGGFVVARPATLSLSQVYISFYCVGRWK